MLVFDLQALQSAAHGARGIGRYVHDLAATLHAEHPGAVDVFAWNDRLEPVPAPERLGLGERLVPFSALAGERVDVLHVNSPFEMLDLADHGPTPEASALGSDDRRRIEGCLGTLPRDRAAAVTAAYVEGWSYEELARRFDVPLNTMRTWLRRALIALRECLGS